MKKIIILSTLVTLNLYSNNYFVKLEDKFYKNNIKEVRTDLGVEICTYFEYEGSPNNSVDNTFNNTTMYYSNTNSFNWNGNHLGKLRKRSNLGQMVIVKNKYKYYSGGYVANYNYYACSLGIETGKWKKGVKESDLKSTLKRSLAYTYQYPEGEDCELGVRNYYYVQLNVKSYGLSDYHRYYQECE